MIDNNHQHDVYDENYDVENNWWLWCWLVDNNCWIWCWSWTVVNDPAWLMIMIRMDDWKYQLDVCLPRLKIMERRLTIVTTPLNCNWNYRSISRWRDPSMVQWGDIGRSQIRTEFIDNVLTSWENIRLSSVLNFIPTSRNTGAIVGLLINSILIFWGTEVLPWSWTMFNHPF